MGLGKFYKEKNEIKEYMKNIISPSGRYSILIRHYNSEKYCWHVTRGTVTRISDGKVICDLQRNYSTFHYTFVSKNNQEWLLTGESYLSQTFVNLDEGKIFRHGKENPYSFCWASCYLSPDGNTLVVSGCYWGSPFEYKFFDFTNPKKISELIIKKEFYSGDSPRVVFEDGLIKVCHTRDFYLPLNVFEHEVSMEYVEEHEEEFNNLDNYELRDIYSYVLRRLGSEIEIVSEWDYYNGEIPKE